MEIVLFDAAHKIQEACEIIEGEMARLDRRSEDFARLNDVRDKLLAAHGNLIFRPLTEADMKWAERKLAEMRTRGLI